MPHVARWILKGRETLRGHSRNASSRSRTHAICHRGQANARAPGPRRCQSTGLAEFDEYGGPLGQEHERGGADEREVRVRGNHHRAGHVVWCGHRGDGGRGGSVVGLHGRGRLYSPRKTAVQHHLHERATSCDGSKHKPHGDEEKRSEDRLTRGRSDQRQQSQGGPSAAAACHCNGHVPTATQRRVQGHGQRVWVIGVRSVYETNDRCGIGNRNGTGIRLRNARGASNGTAAPAPPALARLVQRQTPLLFAQAPQRPLFPRATRMGCLPGRWSAAAKLIRLANKSGECGCQTAFAVPALDLRGAIRTGQSKGVVLRLAQRFRWLAQGFRWLAQGFRCLAQRFRWLARWNARPSRSNSQCRSWQIKLTATLGKGGKPRDWL